MRFYKLALIPVDIDLYMWYLKRFNKKKWYEESQKRLNPTNEYRQIELALKRFINAAKCVRF